MSPRSTSGDHEQAGLARVGEDALLLTRARLPPDLGLPSCNALAPLSPAPSSSSRHLGTRLRTPLAACRWPPACAIRRPIASSCNRPPYTGRCNALRASGMLARTEWRARALGEPHMLLAVGLSCDVSARHAQALRRSRTQVAFPPRAPRLPRAARRRRQESARRNRRMNRDLGAQAARRSTRRTFARLRIGK